MALDTKSLESEYRAIIGLAERFADELTNQLSRVLQDEGVPLAFPVQTRVKSWDSLVEKFERVRLQVKSVREVQDLIGLRIIILFRRDMDKVRSLLKSYLSVIKEYDTRERLKEDQFGYDSLHLIVRLPESWLKVPTFSGMQTLAAEIQLRTLAQHMWAEASHVLQYKREEAVPVEIRRALYRGSAILETLDLEFDRILAARDSYRETIDLRELGDKLNVDLLEKTLDAAFPQENKAGDESYADVLHELNHFGIDTVGKLRDLKEKWWTEVLQQERELVRVASERLEKGESPQGTSVERTKRGVFFNYMGLTRNLLASEFGKANVADLIKKTRTLNSQPSSKNRE